MPFAEIVVEQPAFTNIAVSGSKDFESVHLGSKTSLTFIIRNTGDADLTGLVITKDGTNASDFTITTNPVSPVIGPDGTTTFTVQFAPNAIGARTATIHIANNDINENPFHITLTGTGKAEEASNAGVLAGCVAQLALTAFNAIRTNLMGSKSATATARNAQTAKSPLLAAILKLAPKLLTSPNLLADLAAMAGLTGSAKTAAVSAIITKWGQAVGNIQQLVNSIGTINLCSITNTESLSMKNGIVQSAVNRPFEAQMPAGTAPTQPAPVDNVKGSDMLKKYDEVYAAYKTYSTELQKLLRPESFTSEMTRLSSAESEQGANMAMNEYNAIQDGTDLRTYETATSQNAISFPNTTNPLNQSASNQGLQYPGSPNNPATQSAPVRPPPSNSAAAFTEYRQTQGSVHQMNLALNGLLTLAKAFEDKIGRKVAGASDDIKVYRIEFDQGVAKLRGQCVSDESHQYVVTAGSAVGAHIEKNKDVIIDFIQFNTKTAPREQAAQRDLVAATSTPTPSTTPAAGSTSLPTPAATPTPTAPGASVQARPGWRITTYGYETNPAYRATLTPAQQRQHVYQDSNSNRGEGRSIGRFGESCILARNDMALSPDIIAALTAVGMKRQATPLIVELDDGTKITGTYKDITADYLTGRVDLYSSDFPSPYDGRRVSSITIAGSPASVVRIRE
jgi:hypothetical protein